MGRLAAGQAAPQAFSRSPSSRESPRTLGRVERLASSTAAPRSRSDPAAERPRGEVRGRDALVCRHTTQAPPTIFSHRLGRTSVEVTSGGDAALGARGAVGWSGSPLALVSHGGPVALIVTHANRAMMAKLQEITGLHLELRRAFIPPAAEGASGRGGAKLLESHQGRGSVGAFRRVGRQLL